MKISWLAIRFITTLSAVFLCILCCIYFTFTVLMIYFHGTESQTTLRELLVTFIDGVSVEGSLRALVLAIVAGILYLSAAILVKRSGDALILAADKPPGLQVFKSLLISLAWSIAGMALFFPWFDLLKRLIILQYG